MGFLSGIFGNQQQQPQQAQQPAQNPSQQQPQRPQAAQGSGGPAQVQAQQQQPANSQLQNGQQQNPLDNFMNLLTPKEGSQQQQQQPQSIFGNVPQEQIQQQIKGANFTNGIDQAKVQAALSGDSAAFMEVLNGVAQQAFAASFQASQGMVEHGVSTGRKQLEGSLDSHFKNYMLKQQTPSSDSPALQHPVGKAFLQSISQQIANANPQMSPAEVAKAAEQNFTEFAKMLAPQQQQPSSQSSQPAQDWSSVFQSFSLSVFQLTEPQNGNWSDFFRALADRSGGKIVRSNDHSADAEWQCASLRTYFFAEG